MEEDYAIIKPLGKGSYASVYLVEDSDFNDSFALKSIDKSNITDSKSVEAIMNEIDILRHLDHQNIAKLYKIYESDNHVHLIMEYVEGVNLLDKILKVEVFSEKEAMEFIFTMLNVLDYLHSKSICHRDLKLENIMISPDSKIKYKLIDFGLACYAFDDQILRCGSPGYIAPEVLRRQPYGTKIDIFGIGICLYMLLSGRSPFAGKTLHEILEVNKQGIVYFPNKYWKRVSKSAIHLILKLCDHNQSQRLTAKEALLHP